MVGNAAARLCILLGATVMSAAGCAEHAKENDDAHAVRVQGAGGASVASGGTGGLGLVLAAGGALGSVGAGGGNVWTPPPPGVCQISVPDGGAAAGAHSPDSGALPDGSAEAGEGGVDLELGAGDLTVLVVFDRSGSMDSPWNDHTKWRTASDAMLSGMMPYLDNLTLAAILFPLGEECAVPDLADERQIDFVPGRHFLQEWVETGCANPPSGGTPLEAALGAADRAITRASTLGLLSDRFRVLVVTDGEPNCESEAAALSAWPAAWRDLGVETYVLGLPGSQGAASLLDAIAAAGGTEKHQSPGDPGEFREQVAVVAR